MSGPRHRPSGRHSSRALPRKVRLKSTADRLKRLALAGSAIFLTMTASIGQQDIVALLTAQHKETPRWMMALEPANFATSVTPSLALGSNEQLAERANPASAPKLLLTSAAKGAQSTEVTGLEALAREQFPTEIPDEIEINRTGKGNRFVSLAPDRQMVDMAAGAVYSLPSLISDEKHDDMPRVAFVLPEPYSHGKGTQLAGNVSANADGKPIDLQKVMMARNAAAASFSLVSAYSPESVMDTRQPFDALFGAPKYEDDMPPPEDPNNPHWWAQKPLPLSVMEPKEQKCLAEAIYFEARGESEDGQVAVGQVVLNRVKNPAYPDSICGVVYQNRNKFNRCQFSFACDGIPDRISQPDSWKTAQKLAKDVIGGTRYLKMVDASTHYHATYVAPRWRKSMVKRGQIGEHIFYKTYAGGWN
ncbi:cell wall hydrolase [Roseibium suaedae]|uniref:Cell Wall Hydrolase n=1 Tax=Roseibium suaedae TaxID=735517 RepID=A0A1M7B2U1_9HYPH|nr:cell wall hydrolase [Roseibium suaedae]SHL49227.1 Cell Wall Hydrolase [Roseibium suaedae]